MIRSPMKQIGAFVLPVGALLAALLFFPSCNGLNPLCGSARPAPIIASLSPPTVAFDELQQGFVLTVNGSQFVSSSVGLVNGTAVGTLVTSSTQLQITITTDVVSGPGTVIVTINTPSGNSGDLGCTSGGTSGPLALNIT
jgi:hypothetical protein